MAMVSADPGTPLERARRGRGSMKDQITFLLPTKDWLSEKKIKYKKLTKYSHPSVSIEDPRTPIDPKI
jgi:hypothetical protein